jgi:hypothetical protein
MRRPPAGKRLARSIHGQSEQCLKTVASSGRRGAARGGLAPIPQYEAIYAIIASSKTRQGRANESNPRKVISQCIEYLVRKEGTSRTSQRLRRGCNHACHALALGFRSCDIVCRRRQRAGHRLAESRCGIRQKAGSAERCASAGARPSGRGTPQPVVSVLFTSGRDSGYRQALLPNVAWLDHDEFRDRAPAFCWSMIFSENRYPPRIRSGAGFFGIAAWPCRSLPNIAGRVHAHGQRREHDHAQRRRDQDAHAERPQQLRAEDSALVHLGGGARSCSPHDAARHEKMRR